MDPFTISGNSLGAKDWDGRSNQWWTGSGDSGHWEDVNCGAHFKYDMNAYLGTAGTKYRNVQVRGEPCDHCLSDATCCVCQQRNLRMPGGKHTGPLLHLTATW